MSERIIEADLKREPKPEDAATIAARLGRRIQRSEVFDADGAAEVLLPYVTATLEAQQRLVAEVRRLRGLIAVLATGAPGRTIEWSGRAVYRGGVESPAALRVIDHGPALQDLVTEARAIREGQNSLT